MNKILIPVTPTEYDFIMKLINNYIQQQKFYNENTTVGETFKLKFMEKWVRSVHFNQTLSSTNGLLNNDSNDTSFIDGEL